MRAVVIARLSVVVGACIAVLAGCPGEPEDGGPEAPEPQGWTSLCDDVAADTCLGDGPLACVERAPPRARCEACGCPGGAACVDGAGDDDAVCASGDVRNAVRAADVVSDGLADDVYLALYDLLDDDEQPASTLADWVDGARTAAARDGRARVVVIGRSAGDRADVVTAALGATSLALTGNTCADRATAAATLATSTVVEAEADLEMIIDEGDVDDAHSALCGFPGSVPSCVLPHRASCLARGGAIPQTLIVVDDDVFLARLDDVLVRSVARVGRATWEQRLDSVIATYTSLVLSHRAEPRFAVFDDEVRVVELATADVEDPTIGSVAFAWLPRFTSLPVRSISFRALWLDGPTQVFITEHDLVPAECDFAPGITNVVEVRCVASDGAVLEATVDAARSALIDVVRTAP